MAVPALIFVATFVGAVLAATRWLPGLATDSVGRLAFLVVCGLVAIAVALIGLHTYTIVREIDQAGQLSGGGTEKADLLTAGLLSILRDVGPVVGLAGAVYLLAPPGDTEPNEPDGSLASSPPLS